MALMKIIATAVTVFLDIFSYKYFPTNFFHFKNIIAAVIAVYVILNLSNILQYLS